MEEFFKYLDEVNDDFLQLNNKTEYDRVLIYNAMMFAIKDITGRVLREATLETMVDDFIKDLEKQQ